MLPTRNRKPKMIAFVKSLIVPIVNLHYEFLRKRERDEFVLNHNGQICYLVKALNDLFDNDLRRIKLVAKSAFEVTYIFTKIEDKPVYLDEPIYLYDKSDSVNNDLDFIVQVPTDILSNREVELKKWIETFKKGTKNYKIIGE